jgi:iron complex transport system permease protein
VRDWTKIGLLVLGSLLFLVLGISLGPAQTGSIWDWQSPWIFELRLPRVLLVFSCGTALALSGAIAQSLSANPLADPYFLGTSGGASLGAAVFYLVLPPDWNGHYWALPLCAMIGGAFVTFLAWRIVARKNGLADPARLLLAGLLLSSVSMAILSLGYFFFLKEEASRYILAWTLGSFGTADWGKAMVLSAIVLISLGLLWRLRRILPMLDLGSLRAKHLGIDLAKTRLHLLLYMSLLTGTAVAFCGPIGFVGLMMPHFVRRWVGAVNALHLVFMALSGGLFLLMADTLSRWVYPPAGLPPGPIMALIGIPFFLYLLSRRHSNFM